jgi:hypothetical protein
MYTDHTGVGKHACAFELAREGSQGHALGHLEDHLLIVPRRSVRVRVDHEQPAERTQHPEHGEQGHEAQEPRHAAPEIALDLHRLVGSCHVPSVLASRYP